MMKRTIYIATAAILAIGALSGCQKSVVSASRSNQIAFDAKVHVMKQLYPDYLWKESSLGAWILEWDQGTGKALSDTATYPYVYASYTTTSLDGEVESTSVEKVAKQIGTYSNSYYYGPYVWYRLSQNLYAGLEESMLNLNEGGSMTVLIPSWLATNSRYDTVDEYLDNDAGTSVIYNIKVESLIEDVTQWEVDSLIRYVKSKYPEIDPADTVEESTSTRNRYGFYYKQLVPPTRDTTYLENSSVYVNYVGRLLNGKVFDTNIADTAKAYGLYSSETTYSAMQVKWSDEASGLKMLDESSSEESDLITGMTNALWYMKEHEKGVCMFYSGYGYGYEGTDYVIPPYCPLIFELELVDKPES